MKGLLSSLLKPRKFHPDLSGLAISEYYHSGKDRRLKVYSPLFYRDYIRSSLYFRDYQSMPPPEQMALQLCQGRILDAGAGAGSHSLWLQEHGNPVTALDSSPLSCEIMKKRGLDKVVRADFFEYEGNGFDTLLMMMNGIGIAGSLERVNTMLDDLPRWLVRGGRLIFDSSDLSYLYPGKNQHNVTGYDFGMPYYGEIRFRFGYRGYLGNWFNWVYVDYPRMKEMANKKGYSIEKAYEGKNRHYLAIITI